MAAVGNTVDTLANWAKSRDPDGSAAMIVEMLNQSNEVIQDVLWGEGNLPLGNRTSIRVKLPTVYTRQLGQAVATSTSREAQFDDAMSIIEAWNSVDCKLADLQADVGRYRLMKSLPYFEAMSQEFAYLFFYGDSTQDPTQFFGLTPRYSTMVAATASSAQNVINGGGTGSDNTSMWLVTHGEKSLQGIFPRGSKAGLVHNNLGQQVEVVTAGYPSTQILVYKDQYTWDCGIALADWRWNVRICNIDVSNLVAQSGAADLLDLMVQADYRLPSVSRPASTTGNPMSDISIPGKQAWYCNRTVRLALERQAINKVSNQLTYDTIDGVKQLTFKGIPIKNVDQLTNSEATVV